MGASSTKAMTAAEREAKNWVSCTAATTCNSGWGCCTSFTVSKLSTVTTAGTLAKICVNPGLAGSQVPSNIKTYGGKYYYCSLTDANAITNGASSLAVASALAVSATYLSL